MTTSRLTGRVGRVVGGRYRLVAPVGTGASAQVFLADDTTLGRQVAVKMLQPALAGDATFLDRFASEARLVASVNHPNVVVVHDSGVDGDGDDEVPYLVTEYLAGGSLHGMLAAGHRLTLSQALMVGLEACRGLGHAHGRGLVHRDLKPANLLFGDDGRLRIADFGVAHALAETAATEHDGALVGTLRYVAPEQARGGSVGPKADVYALALCLIEAVTGVTPFAELDPVASLHARTAADLTVPEDLGPLRPALERAGRLDPDERIDAEELAIALLAVSEQLPAPAPLPLVGAVGEDGAGGSGGDRTQLSAAVPPPADGGRSGETRRRRVLTAVAATVAILAVAVAGYLAFRPAGPAVPDLIGAQIADLEAVAESHGWVLDRKKTRIDGTEPGEIVSTDPAPGARLADGGTLVVVVSEGNELTDRPDALVDRPLEDVAAELAAAGLGHTVREVHDEEVAIGHVIGTDGPVDDQLPKGATVPLLVSLGPAPRTIPIFEEGATIDEVRTALEELGLVVVEVEVFDDDVAEGIVLAIAPEPGTEVARDSEVTVTVSKGPDLVTVPDLRGLTLDQAEKRLEEVGLRLGQDCCASRGRVVGSDPPAGERVKRGTKVNLFLAR